MTEKNLNIYNTLTRKKELFEPLHPPYVGLYVCGPTVYGDAHLGHARPAITFDLLFRYLKHIGYKVRYVRNITDVGHLENDCDDGEDKIAKKARLEKLEPMEVVQHYTTRYHQDMDALKVIRPSIEPHASGHIIEQIEMIESILDKGFAYEVNGSVYFDVVEYNKKYNYGKLSGRKLDDLICNTRDLEGQDEKKNNADFALWKKASPNHIMRWKSPWGEGFPGWHIECSAMSKKYLGEKFDIHGGGMDLLFPHHECEIAQSVAATGNEAVNYWVHNNMITINGQKMGKSLDNFITLREFFNGNHKALKKEYSPMTLRFFILQAHYRSTLDFSNEALIAAEKGLERLMEAKNKIEKIEPGKKGNVSIDQIKNKCYDALNDDLNTPIAISHLFDAVKIINSAFDKKTSLDKSQIDELSNLFNIFLNDIFGIESSQQADSSDDNKVEELMDVILEVRKNAREKKDFQISDYIRDKLNELNIEIKDTKEGASWSIKKS